MTTTTNNVKQLTITEMKALAPSWFEKETMKFFNTKIETRPNKHNFFITSEYMDDYSTKSYTIRWFNSDTNLIETIGEFRQYGNIQQAKEKIKKLNKIDLTTRLT